MKLGIKVTSQTGNGQPGMTPGFQYRTKTMVDTPEKARHNSEER
jgi:hypothetical protein